MLILANTILLFLFSALINKDDLMNNSAIFEIVKERMKEQLTDYAISTLWK